jgi:hypothetical protein
MARKSTPYVVGSRSVSGTGRDRRVSWSWTITPAPTAQPDWVWTGDRKRATRFIGRVVAQDFADRATAWMAANVYPGVVMHVVPATGGIPVGAPMLD